MMTSPRVCSEAWQTSAQTRRRAGLDPARPIRVRTQVQELTETPTPGVSVWRAPCSRASGTDRATGAARTASAQRWAPAA